MEQERQRYTQCLQEIDANFVQAFGSASKLLQQVRVFDRRMGQVADSVSVWCNFFDHIKAINSRPSTSAAADERVVESATAASTSALEDDAHNASGLSEQSSQNPPTPKLPLFSKSFAKTPMARKLNQCDLDRMQDSESSFDVSESFLGNLSPATNHMIQQYSTPDQQQGLAQRQPLDKEDQEQVLEHSPKGPPAPARSAVNSMLNLSEISAATPMTPEDGNYGPSSAIKSAQLLRFATPAKHATELLLSSGVRNAHNESRASASSTSSNPRTPVLPSPFMTQTLNASVSSAEGDMEGSSSLSSSANAEAENDSQLGNSRPSDERQSATKSGKKRVALLRSITGTPISRSVANKRRRSLLASEGRFDGEVIAFDADAGEPTSDNEDLDGFADHVVEDGPPPEFDLKLFPKLFQTGEGATQVTQVFSHFSDHKAYSLHELTAKLPTFGQARLELMLDMLVSRGLLRPFTLENRLFWRSPSADEF